MKRIASAALVALTFLAPTANAGTMGNVIAIGDEWTLSDSAYTGGFLTGGDADAKALTANLAAFLGGTNYLIATNNIYAYGSLFENQIAGIAGKTISRTTTQAGFDAALSSVDTVFLAGTIGAASHAALNAFVAAGKSVIISLGTGQFGNAATEAGAWNPFLNNYGLNAATVWSTAAAITPVTVTPGPSVLDDGVAQLLWGYGNQISLLGGTSANNLITGAALGDSSLSAIGVFAAPVPLPAGLPLAASAIAMLAVLRRRKA